MMTHSSQPTDDKQTLKRLRILDAAEQVFAQNGFFHSKVSQIAKSAGVADGTIYLYFKNKDDILICLFETRMERVNQKLSEAVSKKKKPGDKLKAFITTQLKLIQDNAALAEVLTIELRQSSKFMKEYNATHFGEFLKLLAYIIDAGQKENSFDDSIPPHFAARMIFGIVDELAVAWLLSETPHKFDIAQSTDWILRLVTHGLQNKLSPS